MNTPQYFEWLLHSNRQMRILFFDDKDQLKPEAAYYFRWLQRITCDELPCYAMNSTTGMIDPYATHVALGRREVWLEHRKRLKLDTADIQRKLNELKGEEAWPIR